MPEQMKPVTKIITSQAISPLSRADMSKPKAMQQKTKPVENLPVLKPETPEDNLETTELEDDLMDSLLENEPVVEVKTPTPMKKEAPPQTVKNKVVVKKEKPSTDVTEDLDNLIDSAEEDLAFLSTPSQKEEKTPAKRIISTIKEDTPVSVPEASFEETSKFWDDYKKLENKEMVVSLDFTKKFESCYLSKPEEKENNSANIVIREVTDNSLFNYVLKTIQDNVFISSPFKFFNKQTFVSVFQKAFLGVIFDLNYATPYYYTKKGTHHLYFSSQVMTEENMPHIVLLDLIPKRPRIYDSKDIPSEEDLTTFDVNRILLVSANVLYL